VIGSDLTDAKMRTLARRAKVPVVVIGAGVANAAYDVVRSAGETGIALMVEHLVGLDHRRIAYVHAGSMAAADLRRQGYLTAAEAAGLEADVVQVRGKDYTEEAGVTAARLLLRRPRLPTAVVAGNDQQAVGVITALSRAGVLVPGQVSVTGFDDSRAARLSCIDLTTARQDPELMGRAAVEAAIRRIDNPDASAGVALIQPTTVVRSSTGPASSRY
jgi:DNA-binding LacI/PurR family transcriptional regulator